MKCSRCSHENPEGRLRCKECGYVLSGRGEWGESSAASTPAVTPSPPASTPAPTPAPTPTPAPATSSGSSGSFPAAQPPENKGRKTTSRWSSSGEVPTGDYQSALESMTEEASEEDEGLGWLGEDDFDLTVEGGSTPAPESPDDSSRRTVNVNEIHNIAGLSEISAFKRIIEQDGKGGGTGSSSSGVRIPRPSNAEQQRPGAVSDRMPRPGAGPQGGPPPGRRPSGRMPRPGRGGPPPGRPGRPPRRKGGRPRGRTVTYLVCDIYDRPFKLNPEFTYVIGRDENVSICLPDESVSRQHASVLFEQGHFIIEDARSLNGTYVNGRCITATRLRNNDTIQIGPFLFRVVQGGESDPAPTCGVSLTNDTRHLPALPGPVSARVGPADVAELMLFINRSGRTGVVTLRYDRWAGRMFVREGEVMHARAGKSVGDDALAILLKVEGGFFHFSEEDVRVKRTVTRPTFEHIEIALQDVVES